jgi:hypothetical protein
VAVSAAFGAAAVERSPRAAALPEDVHSQSDESQAEAVDPDDPLVSLFS